MSVDHTQAPVLEALAEYRRKGRLASPRASFVTAEILNATGGTPLP